MRVVFAAAMLSATLALPALAHAAGSPQRQNPYASLFTGQLDGATNPRPMPVPAIPFDLPPRLQSGPSQTVVCGLSVRQGDSTIDPAMPHYPPANAPKASIKFIPPPACGH
jgi:hypothetical protein